MFSVMASMPAILLIFDWLFVSCGQKLAKFMDFWPIFRSKHEYSLLFRHPNYAVYCHGSTNMPQWIPSNFNQNLQK